MKSSVPQVDVILPFRGSAERLRQQLESLWENTVTPCRAIVVNAARAADVTEMVGAYRAAVRSMPVEMLEPNGKPEFTVACMVALDRIAPEVSYVAILDPSVEILDRRWLEKLALPLMRDSTAGLVVTDPRTPARNAPPYRILPNSPTVVSRGLTLFRARAARELGFGYGPDDFHPGFRAELAKRGCSTWFEPSVRLRYFAPPVPRDPGRRASAAQAQTQGSTHQSA